MAVNDEGRYGSDDLSEGNHHRPSDHGSLQQRESYRGEATILDVLLNDVLRKRNLSPLGKELDHRRLVPRSRRFDPVGVRKQEGFFVEFLLLRDGGLDCFEGSELIWDRLKPGKGIGVGGKRKGECLGRREESWVGEEVWDVEG